MSIAAASASSLSAASWACRRPPIASARSGSGRRGRWRTTGCCASSAGCTRPTTAPMGYRRMWKALGRAGEDVGRDRVKRLMRAEGIEGAKRRGKSVRPSRPTRVRNSRAIGARDPARRARGGHRVHARCQVSCEPAAVKRQPLVRARPQSTAPRTTTDRHWGFRDAPCATRTARHGRGARSGGLADT
jgi:hypothetical protein